MIAALSSPQGLSLIEIEDEVTTDLQRATGLGEAAESDAKRLNRVLQLTGFSDPVYAEAFVTVRLREGRHAISLYLLWLAQSLQMGRDSSPHCFPGARPRALPASHLRCTSTTSCSMSQSSTGPRRRCRCAGLTPSNHEGGSVQAVPFSSCVLR